MTAPPPRDPVPPDDPPGGPPAPGQHEGEPLPPLPPFYAPSPAERPLPRGCHPLVFGVVMATLQFAATCYFMPSCFHAPG